jgi:hypothetical protein
MSSSKTWYKGTIFFSTSSSDISSPYSGHRIKFYFIE